jgi:hypothetical protein
MNAPGGKTFTFFSGILIGVLAGLGIVFIVLNGINPFSSSSSSAGESSDTLVDLRNTSAPVVQHSRKSQSIQPESSAEIIDSTQAPSSDSIVQNDNEQNQESYVTDEIVVKRDELIETRELKLITLEKGGSKSKTDSLLKVFQGGGSAAEFRIEYWRSPINYRGFKFIRNAIVAFGLDAKENSRLYQLNDQYYLRQGASVYRLFITEKFEPFVRVTDENLIKQLR